MVGHRRGEAAEDDARGAGGAAGADADEVGFEVGDRGEKAGDLLALDEHRAQLRQLLREPRQSGFGFFPQDLPDLGLVNAGAKSERRVPGGDAPVVRALVAEEERLPGCLQALGGGVDPTDDRVEARSVSRFG